MNEYATTWQAFGAMIGISIGSLLYSLGGRSGKWKRRFIGSFVLASTFNILCLLRGLWNPWLPITYPIIIGTFCLGYGADSLMPKIIKRTLVVLAMVMSGVLFCILNGGNAWLVLIPHLGIGLWSVYLGVKNPLKAAAEETFICVLLSIGLMMFPFFG